MNIHVPRPAGIAPAETSPERRPSRAEAEAAVRTLLRWAGDDPTREGLADTPGLWSAGQFFTFESVA